MSLVTPWFSGEVKPKRAGVYERKIYNSTAYWHFNGKSWTYGGSSYPAGAVGGKGQSMDQHLPWRGLAADPKAKQAKAGKG